MTLIDFPRWQRAAYAAGWEGLYRPLIYFWSIGQFDKFVKIALDADKKMCIERCLFKKQRVFLIKINIVIKYFSDIIKRLGNICLLAAPLQPIGSPHVPRPAALSPIENFAYEKKCLGRRYVGDGGCRSATPSDGASCGKFSNDFSRALRVREEKSVLTLSLQGPSARCEGAGGD